MHDPTHEYDDNCEGCKPGLMDVETGKALPYDHPHMIKVREVWNTLNLGQKIAWHRVCMQSSRNKHDLMIAQEVAILISEAIQ